MRFGFAVKILGDPRLKSHDTRRWQNNPHLRVSIGYFRNILEYLDRHDIRMYRIASGFAPYITHPEMPQFHSQIAECSEELAEVGEVGRRYGIRLSFHPSQYVILNAPDERIARLAAQDFLAQARILDAMGQGPEAVVVTHVGGGYGDREGSILRFMSRYRDLPDEAARRLVLENDASNFSVAEVLRISHETGIRVVMDYLHHMNNNPSGLEIRDAVEQSLATWPEDVKPKIHFSSPRMELREIRRKNPATGRLETEYLPPLVTQHSDYVNPYEFSLFMRELHGLRDFDVMLEAKAKDLALMRLREELP